MTPTQEQIRHGEARAAPTARDRLTRLRTLVARGMTYWKGTLLLLLLGSAAAYGVALYVLLCDAMLSGLAAYLTERRGDTWTKEMDYFYLVLGALGLYGAINRMPNIVLTLSALDVLGPVVLMTALVIRFVKTRAEIEGWNK